MKILALGTSGLVGSRFVELSSNKQETVAPTHIDLDLTNSSQVSNFFEKTSPEIIVNFASYTNVGEGEKQRDDKNGDCWKLNVAGVENILAALPEEAHFIQISTDMVFSGSTANPGPYSENQLPEENPDNLTWYGYTKAIAEQRFKESGRTGTILRLIYPVRAKFERKLDYLRKPLKLFDEGKLYPLFTDQQISISFIDEICVALDKIIERKHFGIFHVSSIDLTTPFEIVSYLLEKARGVSGVVKESSLKEFLKTVDNPVRYPQFGGLKVEQTEKLLRTKFSSWKEIVNKLIEQDISA